MDLRLELVPLPVSDVERSIAFYIEQLGFHLDYDVASPGMRFVQLTPPGSACSIAFGTGWLNTPPGSVQSLHLVVDDIHTARNELAKRGLVIAEVEDLAAPGKPTVSYARFEDPDGNSWTLQQMGR